jgi:NitT/TauT family transport system substrate-binding protein
MRGTIRLARVGVLVFGVLLVAACAAPVPAPGSLAAPAAPAAATSGRTAYPAADDPEVTVRVSWCAPTGAQFPVWLAKEAGIFARHRLDVDLRYIQGSDINMVALMRGEVDFLECSGGAVIPGLMASDENVLIGNFYTGNFFRLMAVPELESIADLRGRRLAIGRPGDYDNRLAEAMLERFGLVPNRDVTLVPLGGQTDRYNALRGGLAEATTVNPPVNLSLKNEGFREIYNLRELGIAGISVSLTANRNTVETRPRLVERFVAAMIETSAYARTAREHTIQVMGDYLKLDDRQALEGAYDTYAPAVSIPPLVPIDVVQAVMDEVLKANPSAQVRDATRIVDNRAVEAVIASGYPTAIQAQYPAGGH